MRTPLRHKGCLSHFSITLLLLPTKRACYTATLLQLAVTLIDTRAAGRVSVDGRRLSTRLTLLILERPTRSASLVERAAFLCLLLGLRSRVLIDR